jgi:hypothetical protein
LVPVADRQAIAAVAVTELGGELAHDLDGFARRGRALEREPLVMEVLTSGRPQSYMPTVATAFSTGRAWGRARSAVQDAITGRNRPSVA